MTTYDVMSGDAVVGTVEVDSPTLLYLVKRDEPSKLLVGVDIDPVDLTLRVGHWPDGEEWRVVLETRGVEATS